MSVYITNLCYYFIVVLIKALNEVDDDQREGTVNSQSEESENELDNPLSSQSNTNADT